MYRPKFSTVSVWCHWWCISPLCICCKGCRYTQ